MLKHGITRRAAVRSSLFGLLAVALPRVVYARDMQLLSDEEVDVPGARYPAIEDEVVSEVVGASHFDLDRVRTLVDARPELARATWDWAFGDWESALGAASHVGRRDIANYLLSKGARPDIFTYAMLGAHSAVQAMVEAVPGIQRIAGPHGISLFQHAEAGLRAEGLTAAQRSAGECLVVYLEQLGDADARQTHLEMNAEEKQRYLGDYRYGEGPLDGFSIRLNMRELLSLGRIGKFGGALYQRTPGVFVYNGTPSVEVRFEVLDGVVHALTVHEPGLVLKAVKV